MTRLSAPDGGPAVAAATGSGGGGSGAELPAGAGPLPPELEPARDLRRRRRLGVLVFSAGTAFRAASTITGAASAGGDPAGGRRLRRLRGAEAGTLAASGVAVRAAWAFRRTLAPTSPSAQSAPSAVWTSTRHTTIAVGAPPTGGRVWVSVHRA